MIPVLGDDWKPGPELEHHAFGATSPSQLLLSSLWKDLATRSLPQGTKYFITDDALTAFIYQSILQVRSSRLSPPATVKFARAVDVERYLSIPSPYPGILQNMIYHVCSLTAFIPLPLGAIAAELRQTRSLLTFIQKEPGNMARVNVTAEIDARSDIMLSSWSNIVGYAFDFGNDLRKAECARRPGFVPVESLLYLMPKSPVGEIALAVCLREKGLRLLREDEEWARFGKYVE